MPNDALEYAKPDCEPCAAFYAAGRNMRNSRLLQFLIKYEDNILQQLPYDRNNLEGDILLDVMRAWSRASQLMCNHTSGVVGYLYRVRAAWSHERRARRTRLKTPC